MTTASYTLHTCIIQPLLEYTMSDRIISLWFLNVFGSLPMIISHSKLPITENCGPLSIIMANYSGQMFELFLVVGFECSQQHTHSHAHTNNCTINTCFVNLKQPLHFKFLKVWSYKLWSVYKVSDF